MRFSFATLVAAVCAVTVQAAVLQVRDDTDDIKAKIFVRLSNMCY